LRAGEAVGAVGVPDEKHVVRRDARHAQQVREAQVAVQRGCLGRLHDRKLRAAPEWQEPGMPTRATPVGEVTRGVVADAAWWAERREFKRSAHERTGQT
jgi:hypothetical protein